jgi:hypothetical protein
LLFSAHRYRDLGAEQHEFPDDVDLRTGCASRRQNVGASATARPHRVLKRQGVISISWGLLIGQKKGYPHFPSSHGRIRSWHPQLGCLRASSAPEVVATFPAASKVARASSAAPGRRGNLDSAPRHQPLASGVAYIGALVSVLRAPHFEQITRYQAGNGHAQDNAIGINSPPTA